MGSEKNCAFACRYEGENRKGERSGDRARLFKITADKAEKNPAKFARGVEECGEFFGYYFHKHGVKISAKIKVNGSKRNPEFGKLHLECDFKGCPNQTYGNECSAENAKIRAEKAGKIPKSLLDALKAWME